MFLVGENKWQFLGIIISRYIAKSMCGGIYRDAIITNVEPI